MRKLCALGVAVAMIAAATTSLSASLANARDSRRTLVTLISVKKTLPHGLLWSVLGTHYQTLGTATETTAKHGTVWKFKFTLAGGTLQTDWYFTGGAHRRLKDAPVTAGTGKFSGLSGSATVHGVTQSGGLTSSLEGVPYLEVVFHLT